MPKDYYFEDEDNLMSLDDENMEEEKWEDGEEEGVKLGGEEDEDDVDMGLDEEEDEI